MAYFYVKNELGIPITLLKWRSKTYEAADTTTIKSGTEGYDSGNYGYSIMTTSTLPDGAKISFGTSDYNLNDSDFLTVEKASRKYDGTNLIGWDSADGQNFYVRRNPSTNYEYAYLKVFQSTPTYTKITSNLSNCKMSIGDGAGGSYTTDTVPYNGSAEFTFKVNDGYEWNTAVTISDGASVIATSTVPTNKTDNIKINLDNIPAEITITATAVKKVEYAKLTTNLVGCSLVSIGDGAGGSYTLDNIPIGETAIFTFKLDNNYKWNMGQLPTGSDGTVASATDVYSNAVLSAVVTAEYTITATAIADTIPIITNLTYCTADTVESVNRGDSFTVTLTANDGYYFKETPYIHYNDEGGAGYEEILGVIGEDTTTATITVGSDVTSKTYVNWFRVYGNGTLKEDVPTISNNFVTGYRLTDKDLQELATKRFYQQSGEGTQIVDLGYYITSLKKFYCDVPTSINTSLVLYTFDTGISCGLVSQDIITLDCGSITIESTNENVNDFTNTNIQIMLPFIGFTNLDSDLVVGKTLNLTYDVSMITGDCVAKITVDDNVLYEVSGNMAEDIPYILNNIQYQLQGSLGFNSGVLYGLTPFVIVQYHDNYNDNGQLIITDEKRATLNTLHGLNYINDVDLTDSGLDTETQDLIENVLANGVIFD